MHVACMSSCAGSLSATVIPSKASSCPHCHGRNESQTPARQFSLFQTLLPRSFAKYSPLPSLLCAITAEHSDTPQRINNLRGLTERSSEVIYTCRRPMTASLNTTFFTDTIETRHTNPLDNHGRINMSPQRANTDGSEGGSIARSDTKSSVGSLIRCATTGSQEAATAAATDSTPGSTFIRSITDLFSRMPRIVHDSTQRPLDDSQRRMLDGSLAPIRLPSARDLNLVCSWWLAIG